MSTNKRSPRPHTTRSTTDNTTTPRTQHHSRSQRPSTTSNTSTTGATSGRSKNQHDVSRIGQGGRDLNFYLEYVISNTPPGGLEESQTRNQLFLLSARRLLGKLSNVLQMRSRSFAQTFQPLLPPGDDGSNLKVEMKGGDRHLNVKVLMKRPVYPNMFEVRTGHIHGVPPGCALYQIRKSTSPEEDLVMRRIFRCCLDKSGFVSPLKIYPWLAKAVLDAVVYLRERDDQWADLDFSLHASFPVIKMEITFGKPNSRPSSHNSRRSARMTSAKSNHTLEPIFDDDQSNIEITRLSKTPTVADSNTSLLNVSRCESSASTYAELPNSGRLHRGQSARSGCSNRPPSSIWEYLDNGNDVDHQVEPPAGTLHINLIPTIEGFGWPKGVRVPQVLPNQRPWSLKAKDWASSLNAQAREGESFWELTAFNPSEVIPPGQVDYVPYWRFSCRRAQQFMLSKVDTELPFSATLDGIFDVLDMVTKDAGKVWSFVGTDIRDDIRIAVIKGNLHRNRTLAQWYLATLEATIRTLESPKPSIDPSQSITEGMDDIDRDYNKSQYQKLLEALKHVEAMSTEDPKKLVEMIQINDIEANLDIPTRPHTNIKRRASTPIVKRRPSMLPDELNPLVTATQQPKTPTKPQRNLYRLFRRDF